MGRRRLLPRFLSTRKETRRDLPTPKDFVRQHARDILLLGCCVSSAARQRLAHPGVPHVERPAGLTRGRKRAERRSAGPRGVRVAQARRSASTSLNLLARLRAAAVKRQHVAADCGLNRSASARVAGKRRSARRKHDRVVVGGKIDYTSGQRREEHLEQATFSRSLYLSLYIL